MEQLQNILCTSPGQDDEIYSCVGGTIRQWVNKILGVDSTHLYLMRAVINVSDLELGDISGE